MLECAVSVHLLRSRRQKLAQYQHFKLWGRAAGFPHLNKCLWLYWVEMRLTIWGSASLILHRRRCDEDGFVGAVHGARASFKLISIFVGVFFYT